VNPAIAKRGLQWCLFLGAVASVAACDSSSTPKCTPGDSKACVGAGGCSGGQVCQSDGTSYGPCDCAGNMDAGPTADGGPDGGPLPDGGPDAGSPCNPIAQTGCTPGQRCTWDATGTTTGQWVCRPPGSIPSGGACSNPDGGGTDDCIGGTECVLGTCSAFCTTPPDSCPTNYGCEAFGGLFDGMNYGLCQPTCDPLTQVRKVDGAAACGSPNASMPTIGCYGFGAGPFFCSQSLDTTKTSDVPAAAPGGNVFQNACAPGFLPLLSASTSNQTTFICVALCEPAVTSSTQTAGAAGSPPHSCPDRGAGSPHECRFWWFVENPTNGLDPFSNTLGFCIDYTKYQYDSNGDGVPDAVYPSCTTLSDTAHTFDTTGVLTDNVVWGCGPHP
jgi:hypothetical protein